MNFICVSKGMEPPFNSWVFMPKTDAINDKGSWVVLVNVVCLLCCDASPLTHEEDGDDGEHDDRPPLENGFGCTVHSCPCLDDSRLLLLDVEQLS